MLTPRFAVALACLALAVVALPDRAEACTPLCPTAESWPRDGVDVPSSSRKVRFTQCRCDARASLTWTGPGGAAVAFSQLGTDAVSASADLAVGVHTLTFDRTGCGAPQDSGVVTRQFKVVAAPAAPAGFGTLSVVPRGVQSLDVPTYTGSCVRPTRAAVAEVHWTWDASLTPWTAVSDLEVLVDGAVHLVRPAPVNQLTTLNLHGECSTSDAGERSGLALGEHTLRLRATTFAGASVTSDPLAFRLDCASPADGPDASTTAAGDGGEAGGGDSNAGCGCGAAGSGAALGAFALLALASLPRRRRP